MTSITERRRWVGYAAATWAVLFALRGAYWALGGTVGLGTLSPGIQHAAEDGDPGLFAFLWFSVALELFCAVLALALVRPWARALPDWLILAPAWGAGALLAGHGALFLVGGLFAGSDPDAYWYVRFWGPWFLLGGTLLMAAGWSFMRRSARRRAAVVASVVGGLGGFMVAGTPVLVSVLAAPA